MLTQQTTAATNDPSSSFNDIQTNGIIVMPWLPGMNAGVGYDSISLAVKGNAAAASSDLSFKPVVNRSQSFSSSILRIETTEQLNNSLAISASVSGSYGVFSGSASSNFVRTSSVNTYSIYFLINSFVSNSEMQITSYAIEDAALLLAPDDFRGKYGDYFVQGVITGGSLMALLQLDTLTREIKEEVSAKLESSYDGAFSITGKFSTDVSTASSFKGVNLSVFVKQIGGSGSTVNLDTVEGLLEAVVNLPKTVEINANNMYAILKPYSLLQNAPAGKDDINLAALNLLRDTLTTVFTRAKTILDAVNYALTPGNRSQFNQTDAELETIQQNMTNVVSAVLKASADLQSNINAPIVIPPTPSLSLIPERAWGGPTIPICPPNLVTPSVLVYKLKSVVNQIQEMDANSDFAISCMNYVTQVISDVKKNFFNINDAITAFNGYMVGLDEQPADREKILQSLSDYLQTQMQVISTMVENEKEMYNFLATPTNAADNKLDFLNGSAGLNPMLWSPDSVQYGGIAFWTSLSTALATLQKSVPNWGLTDKSSEFISFNQNLWTNVQADFRDAIAKLTL